jgi:hypothetical protein
MKLRHWIAVAALPFLASAAGEVCSQCHEQVVARFNSTPMAKALEPVSQTEILRKHPSLSFQDGDFQYRIVREGDRSILTVTGRGESLTTPLLWAFGRGQAGQTYVFERDGAYYESRVSFYNALGGLDLTMGVQPAKSLANAAGRRMDSLGARDCFGCHSSGGVVGGRLHLESMTPGVGCQSCHGSTSEHATAGAPPPKLRGRPAGEMADLCGRCHRTWSEIALKGPRGVLNVRFQPYRLTNSKCFEAADARISCSACHDPHGALETGASAYDNRCTACHSATLRTKVCKVSKANCVTCHMPKIELPGAHARFTDHQIRIVRAGEAYPN